MRALPTRRLTSAVAAGSAVIVAGVLALGIFDVLDASEAIGLSAAVAAMGVLSIVLLVLRVVVQRLTVLSQRLAGIDDRVPTADRLNRLSGEIATVSGRLDEMNGLARADYEQLEAYIDLRSLIRPRAPMPALRGWAASPDVMRVLAQTAFRERPELIVECGSGTSSVWLGYVAERTGVTRIVSLEHDERYAETSRDLVRAHGLDHLVEVRYAPLTDWTHGERTYAWYDPRAFKDLSGIGLLFVDGPPGTTGPLARFPALPLLMSRCADDLVVVLDDSAREEETAVSDRWLEEYPELERSVLRFEKGAHVLTRRAK